MYETCIFDLYGTLVDIRTDEEKPELWEKLAQFYGFYGAAYAPEELRTAYELLIGSELFGKEQFRNDSHEAFPEIQIEKIFRALFAQKHVEAEESLVLHAGQFFRILSTEYLRLYPGTEEMLCALKSAGKKIYLLSNAQRIFTEYEMHGLQIANYFDGIFISSEHGCKKPDIRFFDKLLKKYDISAETAIMIGNDGVCDIEGAQQAGLSTLYVHSDISPEESLPQADYILEEMDMGKMRDILLGR